MNDLVKIKVEVVDFGCKDDETLKLQYSAVNMFL